MFPLSSKVVQIIEAYCRSCVWAGTTTINKKALIAWDTVCSLKFVGGFNIINLLLWNKATIAKLYWDLTHKQDSLCLLFQDSEPFHYDDTRTSMLDDKEDYGG